MNDPVYTNKVRAGRRRTYFFDVRKTKGDDYFVTLTESTRRMDDDGFNRHKLFLYKEDFNDFLEALQDTIDHIKTELMPDYDYDEFANEDNEGFIPGSEDDPTLNKHEDNDEDKDDEGEKVSNVDVEGDSPSDEEESGDVESEEDMTW